jgi:cytochrome c
MEPHHDAGATPACPVWRRRADRAACPRRRTRHPDEAKALAEKAATHFKAVGADKAIADFNDANAGFGGRELFVVVYDPEHKIRGSYGIPALRDKDATTLKDVEDNEFGKAIIAQAKTGNPGWVEYRMTNPATKKVGPKRSWVIPMGDYVLFVGAFGV